MSEYDPLTVEYLARRTLIEQMRTNADVGNFAINQAWERYNALSPQEEWPSDEASPDDLAKELTRDSQNIA